MSLDFAEYLGEVMIGLLGEDQIRTRWGGHVQIVHPVVKPLFAPFDKDDFNATRLTADRVIVTNKNSTAG